MPSRKAGLGFILVTLFLDILGIGLIIPILPKLIGSFLANDDAVTARWTGAFITVYALMQFVFSPILGSLSDRFGRRPILIASTFGQGLDYLFLVFAPSLWWLFLGRAIAGLTGASIGTATAYIADVSPPEKRAQNFGLVGMAFGLGFTVGPALGGLLGEYNLRAPFVVAACLTLANCTWGLFGLPESLDQEHRRPFSWSRANPIGTLGALAKSPVVLVLASVMFLANFAQRCLESTWVLYTGHRHGWTPLTTGLSLATVGVGAAVVQGGLVRRIIPALGERKTLVIALGIGAVVMALYGLAPLGWMLFVLLPIGAFGGLAGPASQGLMSKAVPRNEQGMLQGGLSSLTSVTQILAPPLATNLFAHFISPGAPIALPGIAFLVGSALLLASLAVAVVNYPKLPLTSG